MTPNLYILNLVIFVDIETSNGEILRFKFKGIWGAQNNQKRDGLNPQNLGVFNLIFPNYLLKRPLFREDPKVDFSLILFGLHKKMGGSKGCQYLVAEANGENLIKF